jgi:hypothetical protein
MEAVMPVVPDRPQAARRAGYRCSASSSSPHHRTICQPPELGCVSSTLSA